MKILPIAILTSSLIYSSGSIAVDIESVAFCNHVEIAARHIFDMRQNNEPIHKAIKYMESTDLDHDSRESLVISVYQMPILADGMGEVMASIYSNNILESCIENTPVGSG